MKFISRLFTRRRPKSPLEEFGDGLSTDAIAAAMRSDGTKEHRITSGVATTVLVTAHAFVTGLQKHVSEMPVLGRRMDLSLSYDELMIEATGFCHYLLSRAYPPDRSDNWEDDEADDEAVDAQDDEHDVNASDVCAQAIFLSQALLSRYLPTGYPEDFLERRWLFYMGRILPRDDRVVADFFCSVILGIASQKLPRASGIEGLGSDLPVTLAVGSYVPIFYQTRIVALHEVVGNLFRNADELLRELSG